MPTVYKRKGNCKRSLWTKEQLQEAVNAVQNQKMGVNAAAKQFCVPQPTLRRRMKNNNFNKLSLGPSSILGSENEMKIKNHILKLQKVGFAPSRRSVREMAFRLAEKLGIKHTFNKATCVAGYDWLQNFLRRHPDLSVRKSEGVSLARSQGMNRKDVNEYFQLLQQTILENNLMEKPDHIFNMDETGLQLNNKPASVIAKKGSKNVAAVSSSEKGETITAICCCNAEGHFLPPCCIFKGKNKKQEFEMNMPPGAKVYMNEKSAYINTDIFIDWLKTHFVPRKPTGKIILLLDGHSCHCNSVEMLEYAEENEIILFCLPSHTTQFLQPLDRSFFKSLKSHFYDSCNSFVKMNPTKKINRLTFGKLLTDAWLKSATVQNGVSGFKACGIYPFNPNAIPDYAYLEASIPNMEIENSSVNRLENSDKDCNDHLSSISVIEQTPRKEIKETVDKQQISPTEILKDISPIPSTSGIYQGRKRRKQLASILTSPENIEKRKVVEMKTKTKEIKKAKENKPVKKHRTNKTVKKSNKIQFCEDSDVEMEINDSINNLKNQDDTKCAGCEENYRCTTKTEDWFQCIHCFSWFHKYCSSYVNICDRCGIVLIIKR